MALEPIRTSKNGNEIFALKLGQVEGVKKKFSSGNEGFFVFGKVVIDGKIHQLSGNVVETQ
jgi:hypothetical protein